MLLKMDVVPIDAALPWAHPIWSGTGNFRSIFLPILTWTLAALGLPFPAQAHVPLVVDSEGVRLGKRAGSLTLEELRANKPELAILMPELTKRLGAKD